MNWTKLKHGQEDSVAHASTYARCGWVGMSFCNDRFFCNWMYQPNEDDPLKKQNKAYSSIRPCNSAGGSHKARI